LWDFERVMRDALKAVAEDLRQARPCEFTEALRWEALEADRAAVGEEWAGREYNLARLRVRRACWSVIISSTTSPGRSGRDGRQSGSIVTATASGLGSVATSPTPQ
jgi:hypothetical protein